MGFLQALRALWLGISFTNVRPIVVEVLSRSQRACQVDDEGSHRDECVHAGKPVLAVCVEDASTAGAGGSRLGSQACLNPPLPPPAHHTNRMMHPSTWQELPCSGSRLVDSKKALYLGTSLCGYLV